MDEKDWELDVLEQRLRKIVFLCVVSTVVSLFWDGGQAAAQDENSGNGASAFVDPFAPKPVAEKELSTGKNKSFFPRIPAPKMPKLPKLPNLNPFAPRKQKATPPAKIGRPNVFQKIGTGTKNFFSKTTHTLMPWTKPKVQLPENQIVPAFMQNAQKPKKKSGIQLLNFFQTESEKDNRPPSTAAEFFRQKRPGFGR